jgi:hypothetical protein
MNYEKQRYGSDEDSRGEVEEEPNELDPIADGLGEEDDEDEAAGPLAEDTPLTFEDEEDDEEIDKTPGVRMSGGTDVAVMRQTDRQREFPSVSRLAGGGAKRKAGVRSRVRLSAKRDRRPGRTAPARALGDRPEIS